MSHKPAIVIYRFGQLGDTIAAMPSLVAIRSHFPGHQLILLSEEPAGDAQLSPSVILENTGLIDAFHTYPPPKSLRQVAALVLQLRKLAKQTDAFIYLVPSIRPLASRKRDAIVFRLAGFKKVLAKSNFPAETAPAAPDGQLQPVIHESAALLARLAADGIAAQSNGVDLKLTPTEYATADQWLNTIGLQNQRWFALCPGSKWASKLWPIENYAAAGKALCEKFGLTPVIVGGKEEKALAADLIRHWGTGYCAAGEFGVRQSAALMSRAAFYLGNDTGAMHLAAAVRTPCVAVFSAQDWPGRWEPMNAESGHRILRSHTPCAGCMSAHCPNDVLCLRQITVPEVISACETVLTSRS